MNALINRVLQFEDVNISRELALHILSLLNNGLKTNALVAMGFTEQEADEFREYMEVLAIKKQIINKLIG